MTKTQDVGGNRHRRRVFVWGGAIAAAYVAGLVVSVVLSMGIPAESRVLANAATEVILMGRGAQLDPKSRYQSADCFLKPHCAPSADGPARYDVAINAVSPSFVTIRVGEAACSLWLLEPLTRQPCLEFSIRVENLTPGEILQALDVLAHPCRYVGRAHQDIEGHFRCRNGRADMRRNATVFLPDKDRNRPSTRLILTVD